LASILINNSTIPENLTNSNTVNIHCFGYGNYYSSAKEFKKAIEAYDRALQINQLHVPSWVNKGSVYSKMGKPAMTFLI
jgi:tetratricopeptide (TPR) repeat protein